MLWNDWWLLVCDLRSACARTRTFLWMALCLAGITTRKELLGVTSIVRALGLERTVKISKCTEESRSSMMEIENEHNHMGAALSLRDRIGQPRTSAAE